MVVDKEPASRPLHQDHSDACSTAFPRAAQRHGAPVTHRSNLLTALFPFTGSLVFPNCASWIHSKANSVH